MTKEIPNESTFNDCGFAGCKGVNEKGKGDIFSTHFFRVLKVAILELPERPAL